MTKFYSSSGGSFYTRLSKFIFTAFLLSSTYLSVSGQTSYTLRPSADAYVRNGTYAASNYGSDTSVIIKASTSSGYTRSSYLKFALGNLGTVTSAKLRIYGRNTDNTSSISFSCYSVDNDSWTESGITWNNAPASSTTALSSVAVNDQAKYYELDVTSFVKSQAAGDKVATFLLKDPLNQNKNLVFNSKENPKNAPELVVSTSSTVASLSNAMLFVENPDKFPSNDHFVFSHIQVPWTRDTLYAANHDSVRVRINNKGVNTLTVSSLVLSNTTKWKIDNISGSKYSGTSLPLSIKPGAYKDVIVKFIAVDLATRIKVVQDSLTIISNDDRFPSNTVRLSGLWQKQGEGGNEPSAQEIINTFGFKTNTGFVQVDADQGDSTKLKGDEILSPYFVSADNSRPVTVTQIAAYHGCCNTAPEKIMWYAKTSTATLNTLVTHVLQDGQTLLPRKTKPNTPADATFTPSGAFGFKVGALDYLDPKMNPGGKIGIKVWKALDEKGNVIPNAYIMGNDYLATSATNYDYQDNMYFVKNVKPEKGTVFFSTLSAAPSALDFGEKVLQTNNSLTLNLSSLGKTYADGSKDPSITISSIAVAGENKSEFSAVMPLKTVLIPQEKTTLTVNFTPQSQGLKTADLLIYYNNSQSPLRVPIYGIAKASGTTVKANYRINSGAKTSLTLNGRTWAADTLYTVGDMKPYTSKLTQIACTDDDALYFKEQHSDSAKKPWSYVLPVTNGDYVVRLHFAEIFFGVPGSGLTGGAGSRVMSVALEGQLRIVNFDPTQEIGAPATAFVKNLPVTVTDGKLNISFSSTSDRPMVCGVEVYSFSSAANKPVAEVENNLLKVKAFPNPLQKTLNIEFPATYAGEHDLQIVDAMGRVYDLGKMQLPQGGSNMQVDISRLSLKAGFYYLKILSPNTKPELIKLIVQ